MEPNNRHPLECITNTKSLSMLESLIPFVDYPLKLPLALFIKFIEIRLILNAFRSAENLQHLGLHNDSRGTTDIIGALTGISPEMLQTLFALSENLGDTMNPDILSGKNPMDLSNLASLLNSSSAFSDNIPKAPPKNNHNHDPDHPAFSDHPHSPEFPTFSSDSSADNFDLHIQNIFSEYDMMQAAEYDKAQPDEFNESVDEHPWVPPSNKGDV